jgi:DNA (cytosine-5)-methyltransferase 1
MDKLQLLDLFSGIGGFSLGLESTGFFKTIAFVEKDKFCRQVLQKNFNNIPIEEDIRNVRGSNYAADVITGGFPCQPFSVAGKRKGTADDRYLWDETIRVIAECKPRWFIGENVEGLININNGMVFRQVQTDLEEQGFQVQCIVIPASGIGAWHQRKRIWIVAYSDSNRHSNKIRGSSTKEERISQEHRQDHNTTRKSSRASSVWETNNQHVPNTDTGFGIRANQEIQTGRNTITNGSEDVSNSNSIRHGGWSSEGCADREWSFLQREQEGCEMGSKIKGCDRNVFNTNNKRCEELNTSKKSNKQGFNSGEFNSTETIKTWWQTQSEFCGVPNGVSYELDKDRSSRIKALGNSIVPQIARQIGLSIMKAELN